MTTIKSFEQLTKLKKKEIFDKNGKLKRIDKKQLVSMARQIAEGFDNIDLRKEPTEYQTRKARKYIKEFYSTANYEKTKLIRPKKENRKIYAKSIGTNKNFKIFAVPVVTDLDKIKINKKTKSLKRISEFQNMVSFNFKELELIKNPEKEVNRLWNKIKKIYKKRVIYIKVKSKSGEINGYIQDKEEILFLLENVVQASGQDSLYHVTGLNVYTFKNQEPLPTKKLKLKGEKKDKFKNIKNKGKKNEKRNRKSK